MKKHARNRDGVFVKSIMVKIEFEVTMDLYRRGGGQLKLI